MQWGSTPNNAANSVLWAPVRARLTPNTTNQTAVFANVTVGAFTNANVALHAAMGQFGVSVNAIANTLGESAKINHTGWHLRTVGTGPVVNVTVTAGGTGYANLAFFKFVPVTAGFVNAHGSVTTNSTGGIVAAVVTQTGQGFANAGSYTFVAPANGIATVAVATAGGSYVTGDVATFSNGTINAMATITANATGNVTALTITSAGAGFSGVTNTALTVANSTGGATTGSGLTITLTLAAGSGATLTPALGGRAGRVQYETLVAMKGQTFIGPSANVTILPS
jgi:hypothetical protein